MSVENTKKISVIFKTTAKCLLARAGVELDDPYRYGKLGFTPLENHKLDCAINSIDEMSYEEAIIRIILITTNCFLRERSRSDRQFLKLHKKDPAAHTLDRNVCLNSFRNPPLTPYERDRETAIFNSDANMKTKLTQLRGIEAKHAFRVCYEEFLSDDALKSAGSAPERKKAVILKLRRFNKIYG